MCRLAGDSRRATRACVNESPLRAGRVAAEAFTELLNSCRKVSSHGFFRIRSRTVHPLAQRASLVHDPPRGTCTIEDRLQKALRCRDCIRKNLSSGLAYGTADMALNGGHDALVLLAGEERTAASCSAAQRGSFCISSDLQLQRIDELRFKDSSRTYTMLLLRGMDW